MKRLIFILFLFISFVCLGQKSSIGTNRVIVYEDDSVVIVPNLHLTGLFFIPNNPHGNYGFNDSAIIIDAVDDTWVQISNATDNAFVTDHQKNITYLTGDTIQIDVAGDYTLNGWIGYQGTTGVTWKFRVAITRSGSTSTEGFTSPRKTSTNDLGNISLDNDLHDLEVGDKITIEIMNVTNSTDPTIVSMCLIFRKVG